MHDVTNNGYINKNDLKTAKQQGPDHVWQLLNLALLNAEADNVAVGIHEVLAEMLNQLNFSESAQYRLQAGNIAERYSSLVHDHPWLTRYVGELAYHVLNDPLLAIMYFKNAMSQAIAMLNTHDIFMISTAINNIIKTMSIEAYVSIASRENVKRSQEILVDLSTLIQKCNSGDDYLLKTIFLLADQNLIMTDHYWVIAEAQDELERAGASLQNQKRIQAILAEVETRALLEQETLEED